MNREWAIKNKATGQVYNWAPLLSEEGVKIVVATAPDPSRWEIVYREVGEWTADSTKKAAE